MVAMEIQCLSCNTTAMLRLFFLILVGFCCSTLAEGTPAQSSCSANALDYKGRLFQDTAINSTDSISSVAISSVYGCRWMCARGTAGCIAVSYNTAKDGQRNCWLYNLTNIQTYMVPAENSIVILLLPIECGKDSAVNGGWSTWEVTSECSASCGSGMWNLTRSCSEPTPYCNGAGCQGLDTKTKPCQIQECPGPVTAPTPPPTTTPTSSFQETTTTAAGEGALNIPDIEGDYDALLAACGGSLKQIDPNNPGDVSSYVVAGQEYSIDVPCPLTPHHAVCDCTTQTQQKAYVRYDGVDHFFCYRKTDPMKAICA